MAPPWAIPLQSHPTCFSSPRPVHSWPCSALAHLISFWDVSQPCRPEGRQRCAEPREIHHAICLVKGCFSESHILLAASLVTFPAWGLKAQAHSQPWAPWENWQPKITERVVNGSVTQCQREETPWVAQSPAGGFCTLPWQLGKGSGLGKTRNTFGPQCLILKPLCILREI